MRSYQLRRSTYRSPPSDGRAAVGSPTAQRGPGGRPCRRRRGNFKIRFLIAAGEQPANVGGLLDGDDDTEIESPVDPFLDVPWWALSGTTSAGKGETPPAAFAGMSSAAADDCDDLATILRRALMDLASALQEIERQLTSLPEDGAAPTRG